MFIGFRIFADLNFDYISKIYLLLIDERLSFLNKCRAQGFIVNLIYLFLYDFECI